MDDRPNILMVMADQLTCALTGAYGHPVVRTPALDGLAGEGVRFDAACTPCPLCTPARSALFSGRYVSRTRTYDNACVLPSDVPTWAHHLRAGGYQTVAAGKLHFVGADQLHGLQRRLTADIYPADFSWTPDADVYEGDDGRSYDKALRAKDAGPCDDSEQLAYDEGVHAAALEFLRCRRDDRPLCLLVSYSHPHPPYLAPRAFWDLYEGCEIALPPGRGIPAGDRTAMERWLHARQGLSPADAGDEQMLRRLHRAYYAMVSYVDDKLGELLAALSAAGLRENTAVLFLSDHGDMLGSRRLVQKRCFFEWSVRVPLIASFPRRWGCGRTVRAPVSLLDVFPTLTQLAGAPEPIDVDGESLLGLLEGPAGERPERVVLSEYHGEWVPRPCFMARRGAFKYVWARGADRQLYDLDNDPQERDDLSARPEHAGVAAELHRAILERFDPEAIEADMLRSRAERRLMRSAMQAGEPTRWDHRP